MPSKDPEVQRRANKNYRLRHPDKTRAANAITNARSRAARAIVSEELLCKQRAQEERERSAQAKICTGCGVLKPFDDFRNDKYRPNGKSSKCRECMNKRGRELHALNPEPRRQVSANWRAANPEKRQAYEEANKEKSSAKRRKRYAENPEKELEKNRVWYEENKDDRKISMAAWEAANPGYGSIKSQRRRSRQAGAAVVDLSQAQWKEILERSNYRCCYCPPTCRKCRTKTHKFEQEHLTPVVMSGDYTVQNILPSCQQCNAKKYTGNVLKPVQPFLLTEALPHVPKRRRRAS